jgi:hypothetical protein
MSKSFDECGFDMGMAWDKLGFDTRRWKVV